LLECHDVHVAKRSAGRKSLPGAGEPCQERRMKAKRKSAPRQPGNTEAVPGLPARQIAADIVEDVLRRRRALDEVLDGAAAHPGFAGLPERDRALVRALAATVLRRLGTLRHLIGIFLDHGAPEKAPRVETALLIGAAQILFLDVPDHAAVDLAVRLAQADRQAMHYAGLVNAVLRRLAREGAERLRALDTAVLDTPE
jgi:16S rRNA (cytosine967-C5)-methyltransferase